jgi:hypothetical protein
VERPEGVEYEEPGKQAKRTIVGSEIMVGVIARYYCEVLGC